LGSDSFASGSLRLTSYARPSKLFTAHRNLMVAEVARLKKQALTGILKSVTAILRGPR
jgi:hypothetical protein